MDRLLRVALKVSVLRDGSVGLGVPDTVNASPAFLCPLLLSPRQSLHSLAFTSSRIHECQPLGAPQSVSGFLLIVVELFIPPWCPCLVALASVEKFSLQFIIFFFVCLEETKN